MIDSPTLFDLPTTGAVRHDAPDTSREAASRLSTAQRDRVRIWDWLAAQGEAGGTDEEIRAALSMAEPERPRRIELVGAGIVRDSGQRRPTASGRTAIVWVAVKK